MLYAVPHQNQLASHTLRTALRLTGYGKSRCPSKKSVESDCLTGGRQIQSDRLVPHAVFGLTRQTTPVQPPTYTTECSQKRYAALRFRVHGRNFHTRLRLLDRSQSCATLLTVAREFSLLIALAQIGTTNAPQIGFISYTQMETFLLPFSLTKHPEGVKHEKPKD